MSCEPKVAVCFSSSALLLVYQVKLLVFDSPETDQKAGGSGMRDSWTVVANFCGRSWKKGSWIWSDHISVRAHVILETSRPGWPKPCCRTSASWPKWMRCTAAVAAPWWAPWCWAVERPWPKWRPGAKKQRGVCFGGGVLKLSFQKSIIYLTISHMILTHGCSIYFHMIFYTFHIVP